MYHDIFQGIGESEHICIDINVVLPICICRKINSAALGIPKMQLLGCTSSFIIINSKVRATSNG